MRLMIGFEGNCWLIERRIVVADSTRSFSRRHGRGCHKGLVGLCSGAVSAENPGRA